MTSNNEMLGCHVSENRERPKVKLFTPGAFAVILSDGDHHFVALGAGFPRLVSVNSNEQ